MIADFHPQTKVLILTSAPSEELLFRATSLGVSGLFSKTQTLAELLQAIRQAMGGQFVVAVPANLLLPLIGLKFPANSSASFKTLTAREREILKAWRRAWLMLKSLICCRLNL